ncbi:MAG TPA: hypothetical protein VFA48_11180 [Gammaproteobacteria bacterium]|nr:hypothetical protein [Gammaproteobacteria bacterium]
MKQIAIYAACWPGMVLLAILNGTLREKLYGPHVPELLAHQVSTVVLIALLGIYLWILTVFFRIETVRQALLIGGLWLALTVIFEFLFGHWVMGHSWETLFGDYNLARGRIWLLVLIWTAISPYLFYRMRS